jgi:hypothetical protein
LVGALLIAFLILWIVTSDAMAWICANLHQLWDLRAALILRLPAASVKYTACWWINWAWKITLQNDALALSTLNRICNRNS